MKRRPGWSLMVGGSSRPLNELVSSVDLPAWKPMKLPDSSVLSPDTPLSEMRGSTTQNFASSTIRPAECLAIFAFTSTLE